LRIDLIVTPENGEPIPVSVGQREFAAWEMEPFGCSSADAGDKCPVLFFRYTAYAALKRQRRLDAINGRPPSFEVWSDGIDSVDAPEDPDDAAGEPEPPTPPNPPSAG
jgi:hypothetical protein